MSLRARVIGAAIAATIAVLLGVFAAWPIYETPWLLLPAAVGLLLGVLLAVAAARWRLHGSVVLMLGVLLFALTVVPVAVPRAMVGFPTRLLDGTVDGLAAVVTGWKQLLTLTLPLGTYQTVMVPAYVTFGLCAFFAVWLAQKGGRLGGVAALPLVGPVLFGAMFGSAEQSATLQLWSLTVPAPRELLLWLAAGTLGAAWVVWVSGAERRLALRLGKDPQATGGKGRAVRGRLARLVSAVAIVVVSMFAAMLLSQGLSGAEPRLMPRERVDPEVVVSSRPSPLAEYRAWKQDDRIDLALFEISADVPPPRLRLAVLDSYDGVDFQVGTAGASLFTRFPSGGQVAEPSLVGITLLEGYSDIWAPTAELGSVPSFEGPRLDALSDSFYVNRVTGGAIVLAEAQDGTVGLTEGDAYRAQMSTAADTTLSADPVRASSSIDLAAMPELTTWLREQAQPQNAAGLLELVERLRDRGYLSHSIGGSDSLWVERLAAQYGTVFQSSTGGHSMARIEQLFSQLNAQQRLAGESGGRASNSDMLVAAVGDDEQFAAATALLARALGYDSRVVLGVRLAGGGAADVPGVPACVEICTGESLAAWVEVRGSDGVWVPIDATPQASIAPSLLERGEQLPEYATVPEQRDVREIDPPLSFGERDEDPSSLEELPESSWLLPVLRLALLSLLALALIAIPLLFLPFAKRLRSRRRRRDETPEVRALLAWQELVDRAADAGVEVPDGASRRQIAQAMGGERARWIAAEVDRAVFSPQGITDTDADAVWAAVEAALSEHEASLGKRAKLRESYALRSYGVAFGTGHRAGAQLNVSPDEPRA